MTPERWRQIEDLYHAARERGRAVLDDADAELRAEVERLLSQDGGGRILDGAAAGLLTNSTLTVLAPGSQLGPYRIESRLGAGGMGEVFRATDTRLHRTVAIKILPRDKSTDPERKRRLLLEARAASALNHPHIVTLHDIATDDGIDFLVMEYVPGTSLDKLISPNKGLRFSEALDYAIQIAGALAAAHEAGIVHRDIKPANVIVTAEGQVKVLDFGIAKLTERTRSPEPDEPAMTEPGMVMGTVAYMSPEQAGGRPADHRSDIFSLGIVLYEMLAGRRPFEGQSQAETMQAIIHHAAPPLPATPPGLQDVFDKALAKDPRARYHHAGDLALDLTRLLDRPRPEPQPKTQAALRRAQSHQWPVALSVLALLVAAGFWRLATEPQQPEMSKYRVRQFAAEEGAELFPAWSPDGKWIAYAAQRKSDWELTVKALDGSPPVVLARASDKGGGLGLLSISWTPDGSRLYYIDTIGITYGHAFSVARAGGEPQPALEGLVDALALSPDGSTLAAMMREEWNGKQQRSLTLYSPPGSPGKRIRTFPDFTHQTRIAWSPDGSRMAIWSQDPEFWVIDRRTGNAAAFASPDPYPIHFNFTWLDNQRIIVSWPRKDDFTEARTDLWVLDTATRRMTLLFPSTESLTDPAVSPDGRSVAFSSGSLDFDVVELPLDGRPAGPLLATGHWEDSPVWSPVAPEFAYVTPEGIRLRSKDGSRDGFIASLASFPNKVAGFASPSFSPDGTRIAYTAIPESPVEHGQIWISRVSGGAPAQLGDFKGAFYGPSWSPDGKWMVFNWAETAWPPTKLAKLRLGATGPLTVLADEACDFAPSWSPDGSRILCSRDGILYTMSADGGSPEYLGREYEPIAAWSREMRYIYAIRNADGKRRLGKLDWKRGAFQPIVDVPKEWSIHVKDLGQERLSLSPDGKSLATTVYRNTGDIWILDGFEAPLTLWQKLWRR